MKHLNDLFIKNRSPRFFRGTREKITIIPHNPTDRRTIENYLTVYAYPFYTTVFGDIIVSVPVNSIAVSNLRSAINKLTGNVTHFAFNPNRELS